MKSGANGDFASSNPADKLIDLVSRMKPQYRKGAMWLMNSTTEAAVRKLKDSQNQYLWVTGIAPGQPNALLGYPVITAEQMPDLATNSLSIAFGNFNKAYTIMPRLGAVPAGSVYLEAKRAALHLHVSVAP